MKELQQKIKINIGAATKNLDIIPEPYPVNGRDLMTGIPRQIVVRYENTAEALDKSIMKIEEAVLKALEITPPNSSSDIYSTWAVSHRRRGFAQRIGQAPFSQDKTTCHRCR